MADVRNSAHERSDTLSNLGGELKSTFSELGKEARDLCVDAAPIVGDLTGKLYGAGTLAVTDNPVAAKAVDTLIDNTVSRGWPHTCDLPSNLIAAAKDAGSAIGEKAMPILDSLANLVGEIVTDVRQQVVEQGWFGRTVTGPEKFDDLVNERCGPASDQSASPAPEQSQSIDIDR